MPTIASSRQKGTDERIQAHRISDSEYRVYNPTSKSAYSVLRSAGGTWHCTCPFAVKGNHLRNGSECKHLRRVLDKLQGCGVGTCREGKLCASCLFVERMLE
jgi:hypothetical protein